MRLLKSALDVHNQAAELRHKARQPETKIENRRMTAAGVGLFAGTLVLVGGGVMLLTAGIEVDFSQRAHREYQGATEIVQQLGWGAVNTSGFLLGTGLLGGGLETGSVAVALAMPRRREQEPQL